MLKTPIPAAPISDFHPNNYYADEWIRIADGYVRIYGTFYSTAHINSVSTQILEANRLAPAIIGFILGGAIGYAIGYVINWRSGLPIAIGLIVGLILAVILAFIQKNSYVLIMRMSSGEAPRLVSRDIDYVNRLRDIIVRVVAARAIQ